MYFHDEEGRVKAYSLGEIIKACYEKYRLAYESKLDKEYDSLVRQKSIYECLADMSKHTNIVINNSLSNSDKAKELAKVIYYSDDIIEEALSKPISWLKNDTKAIEKADKDIKNNRSKYRNINKTILAELEKI